MLRGKVLEKALLVALAARKSLLLFAREITRRRFRDIQILLLDLAVHHCLQKRLVRALVGVDPCTARSFAPVEVEESPICELNPPYDLAKALHPATPLKGPAEGDLTPDHLLDILWKGAKRSVRGQAEEVVRVAALLRLVAEKSAAHALEDGLKILHLRTRLAARLKNTARTHCRRV